MGVLFLRLRWDVYPNVWTWKWETDSFEYIPWNAHGIDCYILVVKRNRGISIERLTRTLSASIQASQSSLSLLLFSRSTNASESTGLLRSTLCFSTHALTFALLMTASAPPLFLCSSTSIASSVAMMSSGTMNVLCPRSCTVKVFFEGQDSSVRASVCDQ